MLVVEDGEPGGILDEEAVEADMDPAVSLKQAALRQLTKWSLVGSTMRSAFRRRVGASELLGTNCGGG